MELIAFLITLALAVGIIYFLWPARKRNKDKIKEFPKNWETILEAKVSFYRNLSAKEKARFKDEVIIFFNEVLITGVQMEVEDETKLYVACSAIIPVFYFQEWAYINLSEVLVYRGTVQPNQRQEADEKNNILGQVRPFQNKHLLLISADSLERGFDSMNGKENVGLHEFAHMVDEADGDIDGIPRMVMPEELVRPWTEVMYKEIERIKKGRSDINPYGLKNHAEFFAVVCEYFFENPDKFQKKHPELAQLLNKTFKRRKR